MSAPGVLLLTVGTGTVDQLKATLIEPFRKSLAKGQWAKVVLLPSKTTEENAFLLRDSLPAYPIEVRALPKAGDEEDADACFVHFDRVIGELIREGWSPELITADITRGTKPMSAALLLAAAAHSINNVRYITAGQRDERGMAVPGTEQPMDIHTEQVLRRQRVLLGHELLARGDYAAVQTLFLGAPRVRYSGPMEKEIAWLAWAAAFWGAWDRFDYPEANRRARNRPAPGESPPSLQPFLPQPDQEKLLERLAGPAPPSNPDNAGYCRVLGADLLANAARRLRERRYEEVLVRLYRLLELLVQLRLFARGVDTRKLDKKNPLVAEWLDENPYARFPLSRADAAELLVWIEERGGAPAAQQFARKLLESSWPGEFNQKRRNRSVLVHGFRALTGNSEEQLAGLLDKIRDLYLEEHPRNRVLLDAAQFRFLKS